MNEGCASRDAGAAEVRGNFFLGARAMEQSGSAVEQGDERQSEGRVLAGTKLNGEPLLDEFKGRHRFFLSEGHGPVFGNEAVVMGMSSEEIEGPFARLHGRPRGADSGEKIAASAATQQRKKITLVREALVKSGGGGARGAGDGAHGEGVFAAFAPDTMRGVEDAAFQASIRYARHEATFRVLLVPEYILYSVKPTMYK
jgi:hypothetical protein